MAISQIPALTAHISFLLSKLIFGRPHVGKSTPHQTEMIDSYSENSYLADQVSADLPPLVNGNFTDSCSDSSYFIPTLKTHIWQTTCWQIYPTSNRDDRLIPTLRTHIWQTRCWQIYPPLSNGNYRFLL